MDSGGRRKMPWMLKARPRKTVADFMRLPEGTLAELIDGEIYTRSPSPETVHQRVVGHIYLALRTFVEPRRLGEVLLSPLDVHLGTGDIVEPDVIFVRAGRRLVRRWIYGAPDLLVEVISPSRPERDLIVKRRVYMDAGVREYWIVDPKARTVEVLALAGTRWRPAGYFRVGNAIRSRVLPGLRLPVRRVFR